MRSSTLPGSVLVASLALLVGACPASVEDVCHDDVCGVAIPPGCNPVDDIENQPSCVVSSFGIFVDAVRGSDASAGTKEAPVRTIGKALTVLGGRSRVYLCEGTYPEHVIVNGAVSLFGGFACDSWSFVGSRPRIAPEDEGAGIVFGPAASASTISDLEVTSKDAVTPSASSIAVFVKGDVASLTLRRVSAIAGNAFPTAVSPGPPLSNVAGRTEGNPARGITGGPTKTCDCPLSGQSVGGRGGDGAAAAVTALDGARGAATPSSPTGTSDGRAGLGAKSTGMACTAGGKGPNGSAGIGGTGARVLGTLTEDGWTPGVGTSGEYGRPGVGGGGGGGGNQSGGAGGGGGACGGCGGVGGAAGSGGGSSIAIAVGARSAIVLEQCTLVAGAGGPGISGGRGGAAVPGGTGATAATGACAGGDGGDGAGGSGGGGGAGGSSIGVLHAGAPPTIDASTTLRTAARGAAGGPGGVAGAAAGSGVVGATGGVGLAGVAEPTHALTVAP